MARFKKTFALFLILILLFPFIADAGWLTGYAHSKSHVINAATGAGTNYPVSMKIYPGAGSDSGDTVYLNSKANYFPNDIVITGSDATTLLSHWHDDNNNFKIKITDSLESINRTIHIYYGLSAGNDSKVDPLSMSAGMWRKYASNPVISVGSAGQWDDYWIAINSIVKSGNTYCAYYHGKRSTTEFQIGLATSTDGITWNKNGSNPIFTFGAGGQWDDKQVANPLVWIEDSTWYMLYSGTNVATGKTQIGLATSTDGIVWTRSGSNPVMSYGGAGTWDLQAVANGQNIFKEGSTYYLYYTGWNAAGAQKIGLATSTTLTSWAKEATNPVLNIGTAGLWDSYTVLSPFVKLFGSTYYMWYQGNPDSGEFTAIGIATSTDKITWTKDTTANPILMHTESGNWDDTWTEQPVLVDFGSHWKLYFGSSGSGAHSTIVGDGFATYIKTGDGNDVFLSFNPFTYGKIDTTNWNNADAYTMSQGLLTKYLAGASAMATFKSVATNLAYPLCLEAKMKTGIDFTSAEGSTPSFAMGWDTAWYTLGYQVFHGRYGGIDKWFLQKANTGENSTTTEAIAANTFYNLKLTITATAQKFYVDGNLKGSLTTTPPAAQKGIVLFNQRVEGAAFTTYFDWVFARKFTDPEPTHGAWGSEENAPTGEFRIMHGGSLNNIGIKTGGRL